MREQLYQIPWQDLTHAYGSAEDVPELLLALQSASADLKGEDAPLWCLFGNIWHQGTVYEATAYAVPFLIEVAMDVRTPDRAGVLMLLAEIAKGGLQCAQSRRPEEKTHGQQSYDAVLMGFEQLNQLSHEASDLRYAAANVLTQFPSRSAEVAAVLCRLLQDETRSEFRAGTLLLLGDAGDRGAQTIKALSDAVQASNADERHAAAVAIAELNLDPLPDGAREAIMDAILHQQLETVLANLPWQTRYVNAISLYERLDATSQDAVIDKMISVLEAGHVDTDQTQWLVHLLFPSRSGPPMEPIRLASMTGRQRRAIRALYAAMKAGHRVFYSLFASHGLPDTMREWRELADGIEPTPVDESLPTIGDTQSPPRRLSASELCVGREITNRYFGRGTILELMVDESVVRLKVRFDEEGTMELSYQAEEL